MLLLGHTKRAPTQQFEEDTMSQRQEELRERFMAEAKVELDAELAPHHKRIKELQGEIEQEQGAIKSKTEGSHYYQMMMKD